MPSSGYTSSGRARPDLASFCSRCTKPTRRPPTSWSPRSSISPARSMRRSSCSSAVLASSVSRCRFTSSPPFCAASTASSATRTASLLRTRADSITAFCSRSASRLGPCALNRSRISLASQPPMASYTASNRKSPASASSFAAAFSCALPKFCLTLFWTRPNARPSPRLRLAFSSKSLSRSTLARSLLAASRRCPMSRQRSASSAETS
mmetsp:Transcript_4446/g.10870  ORF Transcript_4446/g.10870 Transcript_4446/m.10870 type:complete len:208 (-) Transcript_4446:332-955(-)